MTGLFFCGRDKVVVILKVILTKGNHYTPRQYTALNFSGNVSCRALLPGQALLIRRSPHVTGDAGVMKVRSTSRMQQASGYLSAELAMYMCISTRTHYLGSV